jgi:hypothetical protein
MSQLTLHFFAPLDVPVAAAPDSPLILRLVALFLDALAASYNSESPPALFFAASARIVVPRSAHVVRYFHRHAQGGKSMTNCHVLRPGD